MSKRLSLKLKDEVFIEVEKVTRQLNTSRNAYINEALSFFNKINNRRLLRDQLQKESTMVQASSLEVLREFEMLEDDVLE